MHDWHENRTMRGPAMAFLLLCGVNTLALWVAATLFPASIAFDSISALFVSGLLLGLVNALIKPVLLILTLPLSVLSMGLLAPAAASRLNVRFAHVSLHRNFVFILVINALMFLLVAWLVTGFTVAGFWAGFWIALFVSVFSLVVNALLGPRL